MFSTEVSISVPNIYKPVISIFFNRCQHPSGGFGGGPMQFAHLAPTYAAINALVILQSTEAYKIIDR
jgi:protein farnesyltransferase subunit beta